MLKRKGPQLLSLFDTQEFFFMMEENQTKRFDYYRIATFFTLYSDFRDPDMQKMVLFELMLPNAGLTINCNQDSVRSIVENMITISSKIIAESVKAEKRSEGTEQDQKVFDEIFGVLSSAVQDANLKEEIVSRVIRKIVFGGKKGKGNQLD